MGKANGVRVVMWYYIVAAAAGAAFAAGFYVGRRATRRRLSWVLERAMAIEEAESKRRPRPREDGGGAEGQ
jgi:hypothetical protein